MSDSDSLNLEKVNTVSAFLLDYLVPVVIFFLVPYSLYYTFVVAPSEKVMGPVQRVLYYHVGAAFSSYLMLGVLFFCSILYFAFNHEVYYLVSKAAAAVAFLFSTIVLMTGMLWGYSSWNTWWNWEPRLVSMLLLWVFLVSFLYVQVVTFSSERVKAVVSSILGIVCAVQVPVVVFSIKLLDRTQQLHPEVVAMGGLTDPSYTHAMIFSSIALLLLSAYLCRLLYRILRIDATGRGINKKILMNS
jgi:heme exporter protein C